MRKYVTWLTMFLLILGWTSLPGQGEEANPASGKDVTVTVTVKQPRPGTHTALKADEVFVHQNNQRRQVVRLVRAEGQNGGLDVAILIDDSLDASIGSHYGELRSFIESLPANTKVAVAYASHGSAVMAEDFTVNHEQAAAAIRITSGLYTQTPGTFTALTDLIKHWPKDGNRRAVLVLSSGIDLNWGVMEALPANNPDVQRAIAAAQRHGVNVYTIYAQSSVTLPDNLFLINAGQSCLANLAEATGGEAYFQGLQTPIDFHPILRNVRDRLENQYLLTFRAQQGKKESYDRLRLSTEQSNVKLIAPKHVYVPGTAT